MSKKNKEKKQKRAQKIKEKREKNKRYKSTIELIGELAFFLVIILGASMFIQTWFGMRMVNSNYVIIKVINMITSAFIILLSGGYWLFNNSFHSTNRSHYLLWLRMITISLILIIFGYAVFQFTTWIFMQDKIEYTTLLWLWANLLLSLLISFVLFITLINVNKKSNTEQEKEELKEKNKEKKSMPWKKDKENHNITTEADVMELLKNISEKTRENDSFSKNETDEIVLW